MSNLVALPEGTELVGDYRIKRVLGAGGFGITYLADEIALDRQVTIKEYFPSDFAARATEMDAAPRSQNCSEDYSWGLERFIDEAQALAKFDHPNIMRVYRYFRTNNTAYMVLHFEEGQSLKSWLTKLRRAPRQNELDDIVSKLLEALQVIHESDFLHRDIAPDNIIIRPYGSPVLIDFGSARREIARHSKTVSALVKPGYSPYEQYAETSRQQGPWTDIYALGATLYHAVTGKRPPDSPTRMINDELIPPQSIARAAYRPNFLAAIEKALRLTVEQRPQSVVTWRGDLFGPELKKAGWLRGRTPAPSVEVSAEEVKLALLGAKPHHKSKDATPPPPDAPGPVGQMADFFDELKAPGDGTQSADEKSDNEPTSLSRALAKASEDSAERLRKASKDRDFTENSAPTQKLDTNFAPPTLPIQRKKRQAEAEAASTDEPSRKFWRLGRSNASEDKPAKEKPKPKAKPKAAKAKKAEKKEPQLQAEVIEQPKPTPLRPVSKPSLQIGKALVPVRKPPKPVRVKNGRGKSRRVFSRFVGLAALLLLVIGLAPHFSKILSQNSIAQVTQLGRTSNFTTGSTERKLLRQIKLSDAPVSAAAYTEDGRWLVAATADNKIHIYWTRGGGHVRTIPLTGGAVTAMALYGRRAVTGHDDGHVALWNLDTSERIALFQHNHASIWSLAFAGGPDRVLAASHDWKIALWDKNRSQDLPVHIFETHENAAQAVAFSKDRNLFASGSADKTVILWKMDTLDRKRTYRKLSDFVTALEFTPNGSNLAAATLDGKIRIWRTGKRRIRRMLKGHRDAVTDLEYTRDGRFLVSASKDGTIRFWNIKTGRTVRTLASHGGTVNSLSLSPDGTRLVSAGDDGLVRIWSVPRSSRISLR